MLFNSIEFIFLFLPITWGIYSVLLNRQKPRWAFLCLVLASVFFYAYWSVIYFLLLAASIVFNFSMGILVTRFQRKYLLVLGIVVNLCVIGYFKYTNFGRDIWSDITGETFEHLNIILPLGISFFTFQQITYLCDLYSKKMKVGSFLDYVLYLTFFPHLLAGPITHYMEMVPQFKDVQSGQKIPTLNYSSGISIFVIGLFKKVVLADNVAPLADGLFNIDFSQTPTFMDSLLGSLAYSFQIYFDFSGYSDMAIGLGLLFGIKLPLNFYSPYKASNITEFWRRWHMTLSRFLRDYLYIPLGGNRSGSFRRYMNLMIVMLLGGLWHGAGWNYIFWGFLHGSYLVTNHAWGFMKRKYRILLPKWTLPLAIGVNFAAVTLAWIYFRAPNMTVAHKIIATLNPFASENLFQMNVLNGLVNRETIVWLCVIAALTWFSPNVSQTFNYLMPREEEGAKEHVRKWKYTSVNLVFIVFLFVVSVFCLNRVSPFLYFQF